MIDPVVEIRFRALIGIPLLLFGIWLIYYCDRTFNRDLGSRGVWLLLIASVCIGASFVLLLYRGSLVGLMGLLL